MFWVMDHKINTSQTNVELGCFPIRFPISFPFCFGFLNKSDWEHFWEDSSCKAVFLFIYFFVIRFGSKFSLFESQTWSFGSYSSALHTYRKKCTATGGKTNLIKPNWSLCVHNCLRQKQNESECVAFISSFDVRDGLRCSHTTNKNPWSLSEKPAC